MIQLFDIKPPENPGFRFLSTPKKSLPKSLTQKKSLQNFKPPKSPQIANFKPKKGLCTSPLLIYLSTPPPGIESFLLMSYFLAIVDNFDCLTHLRDDIYQELQTETNFFHNTSQKAGEREKMLI